MRPDTRLISDRDIRDTPLYKEVLEFYSALHAPGAGLITDATDIVARPDGATAAFTGSTYQSVSEAASTRVCIVALDSGDMRVLETPSGNDRQPRWSPDGGQLAFLSDRGEPGNFQL